MCLIIQKTANQQLQPEFINDVFQSNSDGWGVFHYEGGTLQIEKGMTLEDFYINMRTHWQDKDAVIHFRMATHGEKSLDMAHPFHVFGDIWLMHNGMLRGKDYQCPEKKKSDTALFAELCRDILALSVDANEFVRSEKFAELIAPEIVGSSIIFADNQGIIPMKGALAYTTTDGLKVSNSYAYSVNNPDDWRQYSHNYGGAWAGDYDKPYNATGRAYGYGQDYEVPVTKPTWWEVDDFIDSLEFLSYEDIIEACYEEPGLVADALLDLYEKRQARKPKKRKA